MKSLAPLALALSLPLIAVACNSVELADPAPIEYEQSVAPDQIADAIYRGLEIDRWNIVEESPNHLIADRLYGGKHLIAVEIAYGDGTVQIEYYSSDNMDYDPIEETIHKNYNAWVEGLARTIDRELYKLTR